MFNNNRTARIVMLLVLVIGSVFTSVMSVFAQDVAPVYPVNDPAKCDFTFAYNGSGGWNVQRYLQDNGDGIVLVTTQEGWGEVTSDTPFTVFVGTWEDASQSVVNQGAGVLAVAEENRFAYRFGEDAKLAVGQALVMVANCTQGVAVDAPAAFPPNDAVCDPTFWREGSDNLGRKFVDGSRLLHFAAGEVDDAAVGSNVPFLVFRGMIDGTGNLGSPVLEYSYSPDGTTFKYVISAANKLAQNEGLMVVWPCLSGAEHDGFMTHITTVPNVDWCGAHVMAAGSTETVPANCVVSGDVKVNGTALYDNVEDTGLVVAIGSNPVEIYAEWGASIWPAGTVPQTAHDALVLTGCADALGCRVVTVSNQ